MSYQEKVKILNNYIAPYKLQISLKMWYYAGHYIYIYSTLNIYIYIKTDIPRY